MGYLEQGENFVQKGRYDDAILSLKQAIGADAYNRKAYQALSAVYLEVNRPNEAQAVNKDIRRRWPDQK